MTMMALDDGHPVTMHTRITMALEAHVWMAAHLDRLPADTEAQMHYGAAMADASPRARRWSMAGDPATLLL